MKSNRVILSVFFRSFFLQALWNFERLQNVGFAYGMLPILRVLYPDPGKRKDALIRHLNYFNTHPYMVSIIFGLSASLEQDIADGKPVEGEQLSILKNNLAGPLAAIGDTFFWATWRPFSVLLAISVALLLLKYGSFSGGLIVPALFLVIYNVLPLPFRYWSLRASYRMHEKIVEIIASLEFQSVVDIVKLISILVLAAAFVFYFFNYAGTFLYKLLLLAVFMLGAILGSFRISTTLVFFGVIILSVVLAYIKG